MPSALAFCAVPQAAVPSSVAAASTAAKARVSVLRFDFRVVNAVAMVMGLLFLS